MQALATVAAATGALAALVTVILAKQSAESGRAAVREERANRREAKLERERQHLLLIGQLMSEFFQEAKRVPEWKPSPETDAQMRTRAPLSHALVGLEGELPICVSIPYRTDINGALAAVQDGYGEIRGALAKLGASMPRLA